MIGRIAACLVAALAARSAAGQDSPEPASDVTAPAENPAAPAEPITPQGPEPSVAWTPPERSPAVLYLDVGVAGSDTDAALSFDAGLEVHRVVVTYSVWRTLGADSRA
jgi:hypothetical protein